MLSTVSAKKKKKQNKLEFHITLIPHNIGKQKPTKTQKQIPSSSTVNR
jgi:hypothetical protein